MVASMADCSLLALQQCMLDADDTGTTTILQHTHTSRHIDRVTYPDDGVLANARSQSNNGILHSALLQEGSVADNGISNLGVHNLGWWQEARGCVDGGLGVVELKLWRLQMTKHMLD